MANRQITKRKGTAVWFPDSDGDLLRALVAAEDRSMTAILRRALRAYAATSQEYNAGKKAAVRRKRETE